MPSPLFGLYCETSHIIIHLLHHSVLATQSLLFTDENQVAYGLTYRVELTHPACKTLGRTHSHNKVRPWYSHTVQLRAQQCHNTSLRVYIIVPVRDSIVKTLKCYSHTISRKISRKTFRQKLQRATVPKIPCSISHYLGHNYCIFSPCLSLLYM